MVLMDDRSTVSFGFWKKIQFPTLADQSGAPPPQHQQPQGVPQQMMNNYEIDHFRSGPPAGPQQPQPQQQFQAPGAAQYYTGPVIHQPGPPGGQFTPIQYRQGPQQQPGQMIHMMPQQSPLIYSSMTHPMTQQMVYMPVPTPVVVRQQPSSASASNSDSKESGGHKNQNANQKNAGKRNSQHEEEEVVPNMNQPPPPIPQQQIPQQQMIPPQGAAEMIPNQVFYPRTVVPMMNYQATQQFNPMEQAQMAQMHVSYLNFGFFFEKFIKNLFFMGESWDFLVFCLWKNFL